LIGDDNPADMPSLRARMQEAYRSMQICSRIMVNPQFSHNPEIVEKYKVAASDFSEACDEWNARFPSDPMRMCVGVV